MSNNCAKKSAILGMFIKGNFMLENAPLGKKIEYVQTYSPELLFPVPRKFGRDKIGLKGPLPFQGWDLWNGYELSWLNERGKPVIALAEIAVSCTSLNVIESKSFKLYLNSFNQSKFSSFKEVQEIMAFDLTKVAEGEVKVTIVPLSETTRDFLSEFAAHSLDELDIGIDTYQVTPSLLKVNLEEAQETLCSSLLKSNCLATGQPDWGSVLIRYEGKKIDHESLLKYIISYRNHSGFAEHCVEQFYCDIMEQCRPEKLTIYIRYTRRGGLDINPFRSNFELNLPNINHLRQ